MSKKSLILIGALGFMAWCYWRNRANFVDYGVTTDDGSEGGGGFMPTSLNELTGISLGSGVNDNLLPSVALLNYLKTYENPTKKGRNSAGVWFVHDDGYGIDTIGYGHKVVWPENFDKGLTDAEIDKLFIDDLTEHAQPIYDFVKVPLSQNQYDALASFVYNIGVNGFKKSTMLKKLNAGDYDGAANQFMRWVTVGGVVSKGLYNRRYSDMQIFRNNVYKRYDGFQ